ncbi:MAG: hypothetical protein E7158_06565 [Firmicutes bacterium]|nr:hypothetical protein [Bacillota bacterium]
MIYLKWKKKLKNKVIKNFLRQYTRKKKMNDLEELVDLETDLKNQDINDSSISNKHIKYILFKDCSFNNIKMEKININDCFFENVKISSSALINVNFENCTFKKCVIDNSKVSGSSFYKCKSFESEINDSLITLSYYELNEFKKSIYKECNFKESKFENMKFRDCIFDYDKIHDNLLYKTYFENCDLLTSEFTLNAIDINYLKTSTISPATILQIANDLGINIK